LLVQGGKKRRGKVAGARRGLSSSGKARTRANKRGIGRNSGTPGDDENVGASLRKKKKRLTDKTTKEGNRYRSGCEKPQGLSMRKKERKEGYNPRQRSHFCFREKGEKVHAKRLPLGQPSNKKKKSDGREKGLILITGGSPA